MRSLKNSRKVIDLEGQIKRDPKPITNNTFANLKSFKCIANNKKLNNIMKNRANPSLTRQSIKAAEPGTWAFVWGVWSVSVIAALAFVFCYGTNIPVWDDYDIIPTLVKAHAPTLDWLWEPCNEHRIALPKIVLLMADRLAGNDIRVGMFLSVSLLAMLSAVLLSLTPKLPGGMKPSDALFPLLLLSLGQAANLLWSIQLAFVLPTVIATLFLAPVVARRSWPTPRTVTLMAVAMVLLPLCGGTGLVFVPALALWLLGTAVAEFRSTGKGNRRRAVLIALGTVPGIAITMLYFRGLPKRLHPETQEFLFNGARTGLQFLTGGLGMPTALAWPWSGAITAGLIVLAVVFLGQAWLRQPEERPRVFGLMTFLLGLLALATAVGWGRGWAGEHAGFQPRYVTMATPLWCWLALSFRLYSPPASAQLFSYFLFMSLCVLAWPNTQEGLEHGRKSVAEATALTRDLANGIPAHHLIRKYTPYLSPDQDSVARILTMLRSAQFGPFKFLHESSSFHTTELPIVPAKVSMARWQGNTAHVTGVDPYLTFALSPPRRVAGIRLKYTHANPQGAPARFIMNWRHPGQFRDTSDQRYANWNLATGAGKETTIWINDILSEFTIQPDNQPCTFQIENILLLEE